VDAIVIAVGSPATTSRAKVGPESTATSRPEPSTSRATSFGRRPDSTSKPFVAQHRRWPGASSGRICVSSARNAWLGTATSTSSAPASAASMSLSIFSVSGKTASGR
jgi:hypothetical protein